MREVRHLHWSEASLGCLGSMSTRSPALPDPVGEDSVGEGSSPVGWSATTAVVKAQDNQGVLQPIPPHRCHRTPVRGVGGT
jgi:hypothetical protein